MKTGVTWSDKQQLSVVNSFISNTDHLSFCRVCRPVFLNSAIVSQDLKHSGDQEDSIHRTRLDALALRPLLTRQ